MVKLSQRCMGKGTRLIPKMWTGVLPYAAGQEANKLESLPEDKELSM